MVVSKGRHEVWVLQAPSRDVKETWITEIKRVLLNQFHQLKGQTMQNPSSRTSITSHAPKISNNDPSSTYAPKYIYSLLCSIVISNKTLINPGYTDPYGHHRLAPLGSTTTAFGQEVETVAAAAA